MAWMNSGRHFSSLCPTPFTPDGGVDEAAFRLHLRRLIDNGIGLYVGSAGTGETHGLSLAEIEILYRAPAEEADGHVPAWAVVPEQVDAAATLVYLRASTAAGLPAVIYPPDGRHGLKPTAAELRKARDYAIGQTLMGLESTTNQMMWMGESLLGYAQVQDPGNVEKKVCAVTADDVQRVACYCLSKGRLGVAVVGPVNEAEVQGWLAT